MATGGATDDSIAAIARSVADDAVRLAKAEIELAKLQAIASVKKVAVAAGLLAGAGLFALFMVVFAIGAVPTFLAGVVFSGWVWWLLTAALFLLMALFLVFIGIRSLRRGLGGGKELVGSVKEDVTWLKQLTKRNESES